MTGAGSVVDGVWSPAGGRVLLLAKEGKADLFCFVTGTEVFTRSLPTSGRG